MKARSVAVLVVVVITWMLSGCTANPSTPDAATTAALRFLQSRQARDAGAMHGLLTARAEQAMTEADIARHIRDEQFRFGSLGAPTSPAEGWIRIPVSDYVIKTPGNEVHWPEVLLTLRYDGRRWGVAWVEPLAEAARRAYENNRDGDVLESARAITEIDPYHYRGPLEMHFAYRGLKRYREAEVAILRAMELANPPQQADVEDAYARFKLWLKHPEDAAPHARAALEKAAPYVPSLYSLRWRADTLVVLGRALLLTGDRAGAARAAEQAAQADPDNAGLAMLRRELAP